MTTRLITVAALIVASSAAALAQPDPPTTQPAALPWTQLSRSTCGVDEYLRQHPDRDGRGVVIAVIDTGVDMGVQGLDLLPDGTAKVVDLQDFSGEGDVELAPATYLAQRDRIVRYGKDGAPQEYVPPAPAARPDGATLWTGVIAEKKFINTSVPDLNDNGRKDDEFAVCVVVPERGGDDDALAFVDTDGDRNWANEKPLRNYRVAHDRFTFARSKKESQLPQLICAVNIFPRERKIVVHFDDGGHGTHVAGIAAGWSINGQAGFDGIAPGAKIISLKIGHGQLSGGATTTGAKKRAFEYAAKYAREHNVPVVCNLSYGVGSEREGASEIDRFLDSLCRENPNLVVCTSAGNNGPGLSSVGTPAAARAAITVGAMIAVDTARDVWGVRIDKPQMATFSSRGGELAKPDIATPGYATSTVPIWNRAHDFLRGTSMASPYAAGLAALLICDVRAEIPNAPVRSSWIKSALQQSASEVAGFNTLDFGAGCPSMPKAAQRLRQIVRESATDPCFDLDVKTASPIAVDGKGPAAYWRGTWFPTDRPQTFTISPSFAPTTDAAVRRSFTRRYLVRSNAPWCKVEQEQVYLRGEQSTDIIVRYDAAAISKPGAYVATVELTSEAGVIAERLWNTIIVPYRFAPDDDRVRLAGQRVYGWIPQRYFLAVPTGATAMHVELRAVEQKPSTATVRSIFRPNGVEIRTPSLRIDTREQRPSATTSITDELVPGVWEIDVTSSRPDEESTYDLLVRIDGLRAEPDPITAWKFKAGAPPSGDVTITNLMDRPLSANLSGELEGYRRIETKTLAPHDDTIKIPVRFDPTLRAARFRIDMTPEQYARFTDVAVNVYGPDGKALMQEGMGDRLFRGEVASPGGSEACEFELRAAFTDPNDDASFELPITIDLLYAKPISISVKRGEEASTVFYPGIPTPLEFSLSQSPPALPDGTNHVGFVRATDTVRSEVAIDVPIVIKAD
ncbi:MAG: S8 family serine peptidase [Phycisphaerae bacterium]|nr:S8 family serine peptidase [Phycisphaerae bacterium]